MAISTGSPNQRLTTSFAGDRHDAKGDRCQTLSPQTDGRRAEADPLGAQAEPPVDTAGIDLPAPMGHRYDPAVDESETTNEQLCSALRRTAVLIPARNEEASIENVLGDLPNVAVVIVTDNGSTDETARLARAQGAVVVSESIPGYGRACLTGMAELDRFVAGQGDDAPIDYVAFLDADYSDHPERLGDLLVPIVQNEADFVLGSRLMGGLEPGAMPPQAVFGNWLACFLMRVFWGKRFTDLGPFRVIRRESLRSLHMSDLNFGWTVEMQIKSVVAGLRTLEISVPYRHRIGVSKISGTVSGTIRAGYKILYTIAKYAWQTKVVGR